MKRFIRLTKSIHRNSTKLPLCALPWIGVLVGCNSMPGAGLVDREPIPAEQRSMPQAKAVERLGTLGIACKPEALYSAVAKDDIEVVRLLLKAGVKATAINKHGRTALHQAAELGKIRTVEALLEDGVPVDIKSVQGTTPLMEACGSAQVDVARLLISKGAKVNVRNPSKATALMYAAKGPPEDMIRRLGEGNLGSDQRGGVPSGLQGGSAADAKVFEAYLSKQREAYYEVVRLLVEHGASLNLRMDVGYTPLDVAQGANQTKIVQFLISKGAKPGKK